jgi:hypothetical protein
MGNFDLKSNSFNLKHLISVALFIGVTTFSNNLKGQQTFKVAPPSEAKQLQKDSVDNFMSFSPVFAEGKTYLRWLVQNDKKDGVFIVERSEDGNQFEALGFKDRIGTDKNVNLFYSWVDDTPPKGFAHYRIMQVGVDNSFNYSDVVRVKTGLMQNSGGSAKSDSNEK